MIGLMVMLWHQYQRCIMCLSVPWALVLSGGGLLMLCCQAGEGLLGGRHARVYLFEGNSLVSIERGGTEFVKHGDTRCGVVGRCLRDVDCYWVANTLEDPIYDASVDCNKGGHGCLICHPLEVEGCGCIGAIEVPSMPWPSYLAAPLSGLL